MTTMEQSGPFALVTVGVAPGEMLLETIVEAVRKHDIRNGVVVSGIGTLETCHMHYITHTGFPPEDEFYTRQSPLELLSVSGIIAGGEPHLHVVVSCGEDQVYAGHLEEGSRVLYLAEVAILKANALRMTRRLDPERKVRLLGPEG
jgi:hypothetical protein